jgi:hypothetical protein
MTDVQPHAVSSALKMVKMCLLKRAPRKSKSDNKRKIMRAANQTENNMGKFLKRQEVFAL